jgi:hypothetical protein
MIQPIVFQKNINDLIKFLKQTKLFSLEKEKSISLIEAVNAIDSQWNKAKDAEEIHLPELLQFNLQTINFSEMIHDRFPEMGLLELQKASVCGTNGWVINRDGYWIPELSWYGNNFNELSFSTETYKLKKMKGSCLSICSDWSDINYSHFLLDTLGRFELYRKAGFLVADIDFIYCPIPSPFAESLLIKLGIPKRKCVIPETGIAYQFERLIIPSFPGLRRVYPQWLVEFLRNEFTEKLEQRFRRLYIPRYTTRKISNEKDLIAILEKFGFEVFEPSQHMNAPSYFSEAEIVIGAHGAALANLAFCQPGTKVLELMPSDHVFPHWYTLSAAADLEYNLIIGKSENERQLPKFGPSLYNFFIDPIIFEKALTELIN